MTEQIYNALWDFTKMHKDYHGENQHEPQSVALLKLFQEQNNNQLSLATAADVEEACYCIKMALQFAF
jgi:hypothetical protein